MPKSSDGYHHEAHNKYTRKNQDKNESDVWVNSPASREIIYPEADDGECRADGENCTNHGEDVIGKICSGAKPLRKALTKCHEVRKNYSFRWRASIDSEISKRIPTRCSPRSIHEAAIPGTRIPGIIFSPARERRLQDP